ncbi:SRPBCC family protein [Sphaerisporangium sp. TRM90804]|uniref:SRPBCC family protein n=1 Tax=Sphaerisporangium sp. TRM90804 TaxID=3031113 RepID=UPI00244B80E4|nr:SRPBCC family protein [Sphaerisporangium sp. TRM90804]MDH2430723.1 SRPBCC family protein [Sphaerisporangium sp. TRM90804]
MDEECLRIDAPPRIVWELVTDITRYGEWSPENVGGHWLAGVGGHLGASFRGLNRHGLLHWATTCTVVEWERPRRFTFEVGLSRMRWGYRLAPECGGTILCEWREHIGAPPAPVLALLSTGFLGRDREGLMVEGMRRTLRGIKEAAERA